MPQTPRKWTNADLKKPEPKFDLTPVDAAPEQKFDLTPAGYDTVDLTNHQTPYTGYPERQPVQAPEDTNLGEDVWSELNRPHSGGAFERLGRNLETKLSDPNNAHMVDSLLDNLPVVGPAMPALRKIFGDVPAAQARGAVAGSMVGLGKQADSFTSDLGLLSLMPEGMIGKYAPATAKALSLANRAGGAGFAVHAGNKLANAKDLGEAGEALTEGAGGLAAFLHAGPPKEVPTQGQKLGEHFDSKIKAPTNISTPLDLEQLRQPKLRAVDQNPEPTQRDIFTDYDNRPPKWRGQANQLQLAPETSFAPPIDGTQQKLDLVPRPVNMPNEFLPDNSYMHDPSNQGAPTNLFDNSQTLPANRPTNNGRPRMIDNTLPTDEEMSAFRTKRNAIKENARPLVEDTSELPNDDDKPITVNWNGGNPKEWTSETIADMNEYPNLNSEQETRIPQKMRATENPENVALGGASERGLDILGTTLYSEDRPSIAAKELGQNAFDEHRLSGTNEPIRFLFHDEDPIPKTKVDPVTGKAELGKAVEIGDRGRGVSKDNIYTVLTNMFESGKADEKGAAGGFGIAKASPMMGGKYSRFTSTVMENGKKVRYTFEGTPKDLKNQKKGVPVQREEMPDDTPTGLRVKVWYDEDTSLYDAREKIKDMAQHSLNITSPVEIGKAYRTLHPQDVEGFFNGKRQASSSSLNGGIATYNPRPAPELQDTINLPGSDIDVHYETPNNDSKSQNGTLRINNMGLHQFHYNKSYSQIGALRGVPDEIHFNVKAKVPEGEEGYPFSANREQLQKEAREAIDKWVTDNIVSGARDKQKQELQDIYANMRPLNTVGGVNNSYRPQVIYDPGNLLTHDEHNALVTNSFITDFADIVDGLIARTLDAVNPDWGARIEKVGITLDPTVHGIWIPNPNNNKTATILLNPFIQIGDHRPLQAAREAVGTIWHEVGHTGQYGENEHPIDWSNVDSSDSEIGSYFKQYMDEVAHAKRVEDSGHGITWLRHTAEVYAKAGTKTWSLAVGDLHELYADKRPDLYGARYSPEVQEALQIYTDRAGRTGANPDILSGTGIHSDATRGREESIFGDANPNGKRPVRPSSPTGENLSTAFNKPIKWQPTPAPKEAITQIQREVPQSEIPKKMQQAADALVAAKDNPEITRDEKENLLEKTLNFQRTLLTSADLSAPGRQGLPLIGRKEWWTSWKPMMEALGSEKAYQTSMESIRNDPSGLFSPGEKGKSFANEAGLSLTDTLDHREELFRSKWAEDLKATGWFVKPSVRAYTAYLNKLRADTFKNMVKTAGAENNIVVAKQIADFINVATGRGSLGVFESAAKPLAQVFFSPRLTASRMQMYTRTFNPMFYKDMPPVVRQEQLKSMLLLAGTGLLIGQLSKMAGATVNLHDPLNSDFGKIRFGNTRIDPFAGHQQFLVAAARLAMGKTTSSTSGKTTSLTTGKFGMPSRASVFGNFMKNKLAPIPSFVWSWMEGKDFDGTPFNAKKELMSRTIPIVTQDLYDIWKEQPALVPGLFASGSSFIGAGVQTYGR